MSDNRAIAAKNKLFNLYGGGIFVFSAIFATLSIAYFLVVNGKF